MATKLTGVQIGDTELKVEIVLDEGIYETAKLSLVSDVEKDKCRTIFISSIPAEMAIEELFAIFKEGQVKCYKIVENQVKKTKSMFIEYLTSQDAFKNSATQNEELKAKGVK